MKKSISRIIGVIMLIVAIVFIMFALNHPEKSFPWNNTITWLLYGVYFLVAVVLVLKNGKTVEYGTADRVLDHPRDPYTRKLLEAVPKLQRKVRV